MTLFLPIFIVTGIFFILRLVNGYVSLTIQDAHKVATNPFDEPEILNYLPKLKLYSSEAEENFSDTDTQEEFLPESEDEINEFENYE